MNMPFLSVLVLSYLNWYEKGLIKFSEIPSKWLALWIQIRPYIFFCISLNLDISNECPQPLSLSVRNVRFLGIIINDFCKIQFN